jgi:hypothetical protein
VHALEAVKISRRNASFYWVWSKEGAMFIQCWFIATAPLIQLHFVQFASSIHDQPQSIAHSPFFLENVEEFAPHYIKKKIYYTFSTQIPILEFTRCVVCHIVLYCLALKTVMLSCPQNEQKDNNIMLGVQYLSTISTTNYGIICATVIKYQKTNYLPPPKKKGKRND